MDCQKAVELLSEYIDDMLDSQTKKEIEEHLHCCSSCRQELGLLKDITDSCHQFDELDLPDDFHQKLHERLLKEGEANVNKSSLIRMNKKYTAFAAAFILIISVSIAINSGILNISSSKKSASNSSANELKKEIVAAPQFTEQAKADNTTMQAKAAAPSAKDANNERQAKRVISNSVNISLTSEEYSKYLQIISDTIKGMEGYKKDNDVSYVIPMKNYNIFIDKLRDEYKLTDITFASEDITEQYNKLQQEIASIDDTQVKITADNAKSLESNSGASNKELDEKKKELNDLNDRAEYVYIKISKK